MLNPWIEGDFSFIPSFIVLIYFMQLTHQFSFLLDYPPHSGVRIATKTMYCHDTEEGHDTLWNSPVGISVSEGVDIAIEPVLTFFLSIELCRADDRQDQLATSPLQQKPRRLFSRYLSSLSCLDGHIKQGSILCTFEHSMRILQSKPNSLNWTMVISESQRIHLGLVVE